MHLISARPVLSLFCGAGGLDLGFMEAGFTPRLAIDLSPAAVATYRRNHPEAHVHLRDVACLDEDSLLAMWSEASDQPPIGLIGGPPCQFFSIGNRYPKQDDVRRDLPVHYSRLLKALNDAYQLQFFVFENVSGLSMAQHRGDLERFRQLFKGAGFHLFEASLNAQDFGVAQRRSRLLVVGLNATLFDPEAFSFPDPPTLRELRTVRMEIEGLPEPALFQRGMDQAAIPYHQNHWTMTPKSPKFTNPEQRQNWSKGRSFRVLRWDVPSWTVAYGHREVHIHPNGHRRLSVYEAMLLQGFPGQDYILEGTLSDQFRLVGDAVPPPLAAAVGRSVASAIVEQRSVRTA